ncbi:MAG: DNA polymerase III subunit delta' [Pseudomonadota bacterium]
MAEEVEERIETDRVLGCPHPSHTRRLIGQDAAEQAFLGAWREGRLHHGWLISGPEGVGKAVLAYRIARAILAEGPDPGAAPSLFGDGPTVPATLDMPEDCPIAARIRAGAEPRLSVLRRGLNDRTGKPRTQIVVEDVRSTKGFLQLSAADGGWRVVTVDPADALNRSAANALLKMLEEPPEKVLILLICHAPGGLLPTIRSRCRSLHLGPLDPEDLAEALTQAGVTPAVEDIAALAELARGSVGRAARLTAADGVALYARLCGLASEGRLDRAGMVALADIASARGGEQTYPLLIDLFQILMARMARIAATGAPLPEAAPGEKALAKCLAATPGAARPWAELAARAAERFRHAVAVNLDPGQTIIDTCLDIDATLIKARHSL